MRNTFVHRIKDAAGAALMTLLAVTTLGSCEYRDIWVEGHPYAQVKVSVDWSKLEEVPTGMTIMFFQRDTDNVVQKTSANIYAAEVGLKEGVWDAVVFNKSTVEFSNQAFRNINSFEDVETYLLPMLNQPANNGDLYVEGRGVMEQPELIAVDTLRNINITHQMVANSEIVNYDDWDGRTGRTTITLLTMHPDSVIYTMRIKVHVEGLQNMYSVIGSIDGLAGGFYMGRYCPTEKPAQCQVDNWEFTRLVGDSVGYITAELKTFGLVNKEKLLNKDVKLNLLFQLRDMIQTREYHYNVADIIVKDDKYKLLELTINEADKHPVLDNVKDNSNRNSTSGFDAVVEEWVKEPPVDVDM